MPRTYEPIATQTLGTASSTVTFSSIPQTYTDLIFSCNYSVNGTYNLFIRVNGDTGNNYGTTGLDGYSTSARSYRNTSQPWMNLGFSDVANQRQSAILHFMNYSNSTTNKTALSRQNSATAYVLLAVGLWQNTSAITSISFNTLAAEVFASGSTFTLYGIKAA
jgi:hypothetical protein